MTKVDAWIYTQVTTFSDAETIAIVGPAGKRNLYDEFKTIKHFKEVNMYDYDPALKNDKNIINKDVVFDVELKEDLIINYACEKMWPLGKIYKGREFILIGDNEKHNGDCNPITGNKMLIEQNEITEVWSFNEFTRWKGKYFTVFGCN
jgi:hypothetical protein